MHSDTKSPSFTLFEQVCKSDPHKRCLISNLYNRLLSHITSTPPTYTTKWEKDLQLQSADINWSQIWQTTKSASLNVEALKNQL